MAGLIQKTELMGEEIPWLSTLRKQGLEAYQKQGFPGAKTEAWKYTKPRALNADDYVVNTGKKQTDFPSKEKIEGKADVFEPLPEGYGICFENGIFNPAASDLPQGVEVLPLIEAVMLRGEVKDRLGKLVDLERHPFAALNTYYLQEGVYIRIEKNVTLKKPLIIINHTAAGRENLFFNLRNLIVLEEGAAAGLIEYYHYSGEVKSRYFCNVVNEVFLEKNSALRHYKLQNEAFKAGHMALTVVEEKSGASYEGFCLQKGADIARNETRVLLTEEQARAEVNAAYVMNGWATLDTTTDIEHLAPCTFSEQLVKGVVGGDAKGVFQGKIRIAPHAVKTEGRQLHKALLLSDTAEIDAKPELEIFADDVKCSHGAASGELDEEQLFYMQSRGIGREEAKHLLIEAYLNDVISKIRDENIRRWITSYAHSSAGE